MEVRQAALCIIRRNHTFLVAEIRDPLTGAILHRPPGGGIEEGETPEQAVRRELREELGMEVTDLEALGAVDHTWYWKGREVRERAWLFLASASEDERLRRGECPELLEADGARFRTLWRSFDGPDPQLPPLCPAQVQVACIGGAPGGV